ADDVVVLGQPPAGDAGGHHLGVAEHGGAGVQGSAGPGDHRGGEGEVGDQVDLPARVDHADRDPGDVVGEPGQVRLGADDGERAPVDLGAVLLVLVHRYGRLRA